MVSGIPNGKLFVGSCDRSKHNIIYVEKADLPEDILGAYQDVDTIWDFTVFYGIIKMSKKIKWNRDRFINTVLHELGHALGLPHPEEPLSQIMSAYGDCFKWEDVCDLTRWDFETFLEPYNYYEKSISSQFSRSSEFSNSNGCSYSGFRPSVTRCQVP